MTHEEIYQGNLEIAKMLRIEIIEAYPPNKETKQDGLLFKLDKDFAQSVNSVFLHVSTLKFHCDWNWLMIALEFIESRRIKHRFGSMDKLVLYWGKDDDGQHFAGFKGYWYSDEYYFEKAYMETKLLAVFGAVSQYATQYNKGEI